MPRHQGESTEERAARWFRRLRRLATAAVFLLVACSDLPTEPDPPQDPNELGRLLDDPMSLRFAVEDARTRILPGLPAGEYRTSLATALQTLELRLQAGYSNPVRDALDSVRTSLAQFAAHTNGDAGVEADLAAIGLMVNVVEYALSLAGTQ